MLHMAYATVALFARSSELRISPGSAIAAAGTLVLVLPFPSTSYPVSDISYQLSDTRYLHYC
ncbi:hypothetical protein FIBSPDRAFT_862808, partial [Athelia psychrophila]